MLRVSVHQNHYRAPLLQKFENKATYTTYNFFVSETSLIYKVPDDDSGEPKHVANCCSILKCCVMVTTFVFQHSKCGGLNQYKRYIWFANVGVAVT